MNLDKKSKQKLGVNFSKLWTANAISTVGDGAIIAAGPLLVASKTHNPVFVSGAVFVQQLPYLLFSLVIGVYVDRLDRRKVLIIANLFRAFAVGLIAIAIRAGSATIPVIYISLFLLGTGDTFAENSAVAFLPKLIPKSLLSLANSRLQAATTVGRQLAGPPLGAYLFVIAEAAPFGFDAITFVIAACLIRRMIVVPLLNDTETLKTAERSVREEIREGVSWLWRARLLRTVAISNGINNIAFFATIGPLVLFASERLGLGPIGYGWLLSIAAIGGVAGTFSVKPLQQRYSSASLLHSFLIVEGFVDLCFVFIRSPLLAYIFIFILWFEATAWTVVVTSLRQQEVPGQLLGRVNSTFSLFRNGGFAIGALTGGLIAHAFGITTPFLFGSILNLIIVFVTWRLYRPART
jgi:predicted MFS family arabinose efflux permease